MAQETITNDILMGYETKKVCTKCNENKNANEFRLLTPKEALKRCTQCKKCESKYKQEWANKHPGKTKAAKDKYYQEHYEECLERAKLQKTKDPEAYATYKHQYYEERKEEISAEAKLKRIEHPEEVRAHEKAYRDAHPDNAKKAQSKPQARLLALQKRAKNKEIECNLDLNEYTTLISGPCFYCNYQFGQKVLYGAGLDRLNNDLGYVHNNCVSCCRDCNMIRGDYLSPEETKLLISLVLDMRTIGRSSNEVILVQATDIDGYMASNRRQLKQLFRIAQKSPKRHGYAWTLTLEEYISVIYNPCYYCNNRLGTKVYSAAGLDRVDNSKFYSIDNVVSCCEACNSIKRELLTQNEAKAGIEAVLTFREQNGYR